MQSPVTATTIALQWLRHGILPSIGLLKSAIPTRVHLTSGNDSLSDKRRWLASNGAPGSLAAGLNLVEVMPTVLMSPRLTFSPFVATDLDLLIELHSDPEIMRYLSPDGRPWPREVIEEKLADFIAEHAARGHSKWKVYRHDGTFIGRAGFAVWPPTRELELGFIVRRNLWGQGYATECAAALLDWVFDATGVEHVIGFAQERNAASRRVLEKVGMTYVDMQLVSGIPTAFYRFERSQQGGKR